MRIIIDRRDVTGRAKRIAWFFGLWLAGVLSVGAVAGLLRFVMHSL